MEKVNEIKFTGDNKIYLLAYKFDNANKNILIKNPHCIEYFTTHDKIINCTHCLKIFNKHNIYKLDKYMNRSIDFNLLNKIDNQENNLSKCKNDCSHNVYLYSVMVKNFHKLDKLDKLKKRGPFKKNKLIYKLKDVPYILDYDRTKVIPNTVVHWGQIKMFLVTLIFIIKVNKPEDKIINIIYAGSAPGYNIPILCKMFPNTRWYLIDPREFTPELHKHPQVKEIKNEFFTNDTAKYYKNLFKNDKNKVLFISDIRLAEQTSDEEIVRDQEMNKQWYEIMNPDYAYLKFRTPYESPVKYSYLDGEIYIQPFAPTSSTETRLLLKKNAKSKIYDSNEYNGKMYYFNRVLRPSYYPTIINHKYLDHCFDCTYFTYLMKNYITHFDSETKDVSYLCNKIMNTLDKKTSNKIKMKTKYIQKNILI